MSYLSLPAGIPAFRQAVISLWFRVPKASLERVFGPLPASAQSRIFLSPRIVPLLTFGPSDLITKILDGVAVNVAVYHYEWTEGVAPPIFDTPTYSMTRADPTDASYIGVCVDDHGVPNLRFNFQMTGFATLAGIVANRSRVDIYLEDPAHPPDLSLGSGWSSGTLGAMFTTVLDTSYIVNNQAEVFHVETGQVIVADKWHHLLLSFDLGGPVATHGEPWDFGDGWTIATGTDSFCRLWYALDDVNYTGAENLGPYFVDGGSDPNAILTRNAYTVADSFQAYPFNCTFPRPACSYTPDPVPSQGYPLGIPAAPVYVTDVSPVELAELQIFTGVSFDTADDAKRRAFVDAEGKPVPPEKAEELLSKKPDILLHGNGNWIKGVNTGPPKVPDPSDPTKPPVPDPTKKLIPTGKITAYTPEPKLGA